MMDRLKVLWSPNPDGDIKGVGKGVSTAADIRNLRARSGDEFDNPNTHSDYPRQALRY